MSLKDLLFRRITPPIPAKIKNVLITIGVLILIYVIYPLIDRFMLFEIYDTFLDRLISQSAFLLVIALLMGILYFLFDGIIRKKGKKAIISSIQVFLVFSVLPYVRWVLHKSFWGVYFYRGGIAPVLVYLVCFLPELTAFLGCVLLRRKIKITGFIVIFLSIILTVEILPLRMVFFYDADMQFLMGVSDPENFVPYGKEDREFEFRRSLKIIKDLSEKSKKQNPDVLEKIIIYLPKLDKYPNILKMIPHTADNYFTREYWEKLEVAFEDREFMLNIRIDSDGDGLSDFEEAEILSDAYNADTDGDGVKDGEDTDPLNQLIESDFADIKSTVLQALEIETDSVVSGVSYLLDNEFYNGHGEFSNIDKHVILLSPDQINKWNIIFGEQYLCNDGLQRSFFGQRLFFGKYMFGLTGQLVIIGVIQFHGVWADASGLVFLLIKLYGKWYLVAERCIWY